MEKGVWRTIKGRHIFIEDGEDIKDAIKRIREGNSNIKKKTSEKQEDEEYKLYKQAKENPESIDPMTEWSTDWEELDRKYNNKYNAELYNKWLKEQGIDKQLTEQEYLKMSKNTSEINKKGLEKSIEMEKDNLARRKKNGDSVENISNITRNIHDMELQLQKEQDNYSKLNVTLEDIINEDKRTNNTMNRMKSIEDQQRYDRLYDRYKEDGKSDAWIKDTLGDRPKTGLENITIGNTTEKKVINSRKYTDNAGTEITKKDVNEFRMGYGTTKEKLAKYAEQRRKQRESYSDQDIIDAVHTAYIYQDEGEMSSGLNKQIDRYGKNAVDKAFKYYDDNYVRIKGSQMDTEGLTYNSLVKKSDYSKEALDKYTAGMKDLYDRERYSYDSKSYNAKANELFRQLEDSKNQDGTTERYKSITDLVQSYIARGYSKETAKKMAMKAIKIRKGK